MIATGKAAFDIAGVHHQRWLEAVTSGYYPCAPEGGRGYPRQWDENDLISLFVYGRKIDRGWTPKIAGAYACALLKALQNPTDGCGDRLNYIVCTNGLARFSWQDFSKEEHFSGAKILSIEAIRVNVLRSIVRRGWAAEYDPQSLETSEA